MVHGASTSSNCTVPGEEATINESFPVDIIHYIENKKAFANKASWAGIKQDPVVFWNYFGDYKPLI